ncbi:hypothetical protein ACV357_33470, partial [Pseudomonas aeruginosa]
DNAWQRGLPELPWQRLTVHAGAVCADAACHRHPERVRGRLDHAAAALDQWPLLRPERSSGRVAGVLHCPVDLNMAAYDYRHL